MTHYTGTIGYKHVDRIPNHLMLDIPPVVYPSRRQELLDLAAKIVAGAGLGVLAIGLVLVSVYMI